MVRRGPAGPVVDLGCGPGHIAAHLHGLGLPMLGVDQSAEMLMIGRARYPGVRFALGSVPSLVSLLRTAGVIETARPVENPEPDDRRQFRVASILARKRVSRSRPDPSQPASSSRPVRLIGTTLLSLLKKDLG